MKPKFFMAVMVVAILVALFFPRLVRRREGRSAAQLESEAALREATLAAAVEGRVAGTYVDEDFHGKGVNLYLHADGTYQAIPAEVRPGATPAWGRGTWTESGGVVRLAPQVEENLILPRNFRVRRNDGGEMLGAPARVLYLEPVDAPGWRQFDREGPEKTNEEVRTEMLIRSQGKVSPLEPRERMSAPAK